MSEPAHPALVLAFSSAIFAILAVRCLVSPPLYSKGYNGTNRVTPECEIFV
jgi:hypothetical protein